MRKILLLMTIFVCMGANAQRIDKPGEEYEAYCFLRLYGLKPHSAEVCFPEKKNTIKLTDERGKTLKFNKEVDAINYMSKRGWRYVESYKSEGTYTLQWFVLSKKITLDEQILEGINVNEKEKGD